MFGSNRIIFIFIILAAKHSGRDIYPPVLISKSILNFFRKKNDENIVKINKIKFIGNINLFFKI